jgi:hypothetical protein
MLSEALQRNAKHEARLSNISGYELGAATKTNQRLKAWPRELRPLRCSFASLRMTKVLSKKTRIESSIRVFEILPRRCRSGGSPVPFQ